MGACWRTRGCDEEMWSRCPHAVTDWDMCPIRCNFSQCDRPTHNLTSDVNLLLSAEVDRSKAVKETCVYCEHFLTHGPRLVN